MTSQKTVDVFGAKIPVKCPVGCPLPHGPYAGWCEICPVTYVKRGRCQIDTPGFNRGAIWDWEYFLSHDFHNHRDGMDWPYIPWERSGEPERLLTRAVDQEVERARCRSINGSLPANDKPVLGGF